MKHLETERQPNQPVFLQQSWQNVLFLNYAIQPEEIRPLLPDGLELDLYNDSSAWVSIVPFQLKSKLPFLKTSFFNTWQWPIQLNELNVRTYVKVNGVAGIYFFSLDANDLCSVWAARTLFSLNYFNANIQVNTLGQGQTEWLAERRHPGQKKSRFRLKMKPGLAKISVNEGSLTDWLTSRWRFYAVNPKDKKTIICGTIDHGPWPLYPADIEILENTLLDDHSLPQPEQPESVYFSPGVAVSAYWRQPLSKLS
ncbi:MAG: DUF2071 domain-containing protein [Cyanobacteria bacterium P01_H01_bin.74]